MIIKNLFIYLIKTHNMENIEIFTKNEEIDDMKNVVSVFGKALGYVLQNTEGVVIDVEPNMTFGEDVNKLIVFKHEDKIHIQKYDTDLESGSLINILTEEEQ
jgi:hypothetical protein